MQPEVRCGCDARHGAESDERFGAAETRAASHAGRGKKTFGAEGATAGAGQGPILMTKEESPCRLAQAVYSTTAPQWCAAS
eukprot:5278943-Pleurochrysis_carterae.AAC.1